ncbi:glycosyltransferase family 87 protein [Pandoraea sp. NPDC087047]|uniref:glycosyltransferase family 87 protein n=1 Tax=Pandoraea sp. NPDC087047 TaxID=3364390 RepID=UPI0038075667
MNRLTPASEFTLTSGGVAGTGAKLSRGVVVAAAGVMLLQWLALGAWAVSWLMSERRGTEGMPPLGHDLRVFWAVSWITTHLGALAAFDAATLFTIQLQFFPAYPEVGRWLYPPPLQWAIQPLSRLAYPWVYALYVIVSVTVFAVAACQWRRRSGWPWLVVMAFPGLWVAVLAGQNSVVTLLLMTVALTYSGTRPLLAGLCGGLLVIKPQLAVLLPLWWLCGRQWRALAAMVFTGGVSCALSLAWGGWSLWEVFFTAVSRFNVEVVQQGADGIWHAMPTVFALARLHGAPLSVAYALYALVAVPSVLFAAWLWARRAPLSLRVAAAMTATLLFQPYLLYYELVWLIVPLLCLATLRDGRRGRERNERNGPTGGPSTWLADRLLAAAWLLPLQAYLAVLWTPMGQWGVWLLPALMVLIGARAIADARIARATRA